MNKAIDSCDWQSIDDAKTGCQAFAESLGFPCFLITLRFLRPPAQLVRATITSFPQAWIALYQQRSYALINPAITHMRDSAAPFCWDETDRSSPAAQRFYDEAAAHGVGDGFTVPIYCAGGELFSLSLSGVRVPDDADVRWALYSACYRFLAAAMPPLRRLLLNSQPYEEMEPLTELQRQILLLLMHGMTVKEIARKLDLHGRTVEDRLSRACDRLKANSREQAMVRALTSGQIQMLSNAVQSQASVESHFHVVVREPAAEYAADRRANTWIYTLAGEQVGKDAELADSARIAAVFAPTYELLLEI